MKNSIVLLSLTFLLGPTFAIGAEGRPLSVGTQYYIPPGSPPEDWDRDFSQMRQTGLEFVKLVIPWAKVNPRPGVWAWEPYDRLFDLAEKHGLKVYVLLFPEAGPFWFQTRYPDNLMVDQNGQRIEFYASGEISMGGRPGPCFHNETARKAGEEFLRRCAERYGRRRSLIGWNVWNEVAILECYCPATQRAYQQYLKKRFGTIDRLNAKFHRSYADFEEVRIPKQGVYGDLFVHAEFLQRTKWDFMKWRAGAVKGVDPAHPISSHNWGVPLPRWSLDPWLVVEALDVWGTSSNVGDTRASLTRDDFYGMCLTYNLARDAAQGKPWWVAEMTGGSVREGLGHAMRTPAELKTRIWAGFAFGAEAAVFWQWRSGRYGPYSGNYGLTDLGGELNSRTLAVQEVTASLSRHRAVLDHLKFPPPEIGLVWDPRGTLYEHFTPARTPEQNLIGYRNLIGFYQALISQGYDVQILNGRLLAGGRVPPGLKLIIDPFRITDREGLSEGYMQWVETGGTLVTGPQYGRYDSDLYVPARLPPAGVAKLFGARLAEVAYPKDAGVRIGAGILRGHLLMEIYELAGAKGTGFWSSKPVIAENRFGKGRAILCGSFFGAAAVSRTADNLGHIFDAQKNPDFLAWVDNLARSSGVNPLASATEGCVVRVAQAPGGKVLFVFNPSDREVTTTVRLSVPLPREIIDVTASAHLKEVTADGGVRLAIPGQDSRVIYAQESSKGASYRPERKGTWPPCHSERSEEPAFPQR